jgi:hypothetical protein
MRYGTKKGWLCLAVFWLTLLLGIVVSGVSNLYTFPDTPEALLASTQQWRKPLKVIGGLDACGPDGNTHTRELSDGTRIVNSCERLASPAAANRALQNKLASATQIIERGPNLDDNGRTVGEKVVARTTGVIEVHTFDSYFCSTEAASLKHLQWYEQH